MSDNSSFEASLWNDEGFAREFRERAENYIPDRERCARLLKSFCAHFFAGRAGLRIVDLGCGDGYYTHGLVQAVPGAKACLVDASGEMLEAAAERLRGVDGVSFVKADFREIISGAAALDGPYDLAISSLSIHHLVLDEKRALFGRIRDMIEPGGFFVNIDVVLSPADSLEEWYLALWGEWIAGNSDEPLSGTLLPIPGNYKRDPANTPDTLASQLDALKDAGFQDVDCYYKFGIFSAFGGRRP